MKHQRMEDRKQIELMKELHRVADWYRHSESETARGHYDTYASILIQNFRHGTIDGMFDYWEGLKKNGQ